MDSFYIASIFSSWKQFHCSSVLLKSDLLKPFHGGVRKWETVGLLTLVHTYNTLGQTTSALLSNLLFY